MTQSLWKSDSPQKEYPSLITDIEVDVAIVGGGITGITTAYLLSRQGKRVAVLEANEIASGTSGDSTGNLYAMIDKRLHHIQSKWDEKTARTVAASRSAAVDLVEEVVRDLNIDCSFRRVPWYLFSESDKKDQTVEKEKKAIANYGLEVESLEELPLPFPVSTAIKVEDQAQFNPAAFVRGLAQKIVGESCRIYEDSPVQKIEAGEEPVLTTPGGKVRAKKVILATHIPKGIYKVQTAVYPHREYAIAVKLNSGNYPEGIFWDSESKIHKSIRSYKNENGQFLLMVGGHHKVGQAEDYQEYFEALERQARTYFDVASVIYKWSAQHYKPSDGLPFIGKSSDDNVYYATGFSTDGLTYGVMSAIIFGDLLQGRENEWAKLYAADRFTPLKSAKTFIKENKNVAKQYLKNLPHNAEASVFSEIRPGQGRILETEEEKLAVYRDQEGQVHCLSAVCTHMACIVDWNNAEKSWDCPCHGSRFEVSGKVIEGPALSPLEKKSEEKNKGS